MVAITRHDLPNRTFVSCEICYGIWEKYELSCDTKISQSLEKKSKKSDGTFNHQQANTRYVHMCGALKEVVSRWHSHKDKNPVSAMTNEWYMLIRKAIYLTMMTQICFKKGKSLKRSAPSLTFYVSHSMKSSCHETLMYTNFTSVLYLV